MIDRFDGGYQFLSNFYEGRSFLYEGVLYSSAEAAYQSQKTTDMFLRLTISKMSPKASKKAGRKLEIRPDWEDIKYDVMTGILREKFRDKRLRTLLMETGSDLLVEGNTWHDNTWGICSCDKCKGKPGQNRLGIILMDIRKEIQIEEADAVKVKEIVNQIIQNSPKEDAATAIKLERIYSDIRDKRVKELIRDDILRLTETAYDDYEED